MNITTESKYTAPWPRSVVHTLHAQAAAIESAVATPAEPVVITYSVTIPGLDLEQAKAIAAEHPGAEITEGSVAR